MDWLSSNSLELTQKTLDNLWQSQRYSLENIANADTPDYKSKYISFANQLDVKLEAAKNSSHPGEAAAKAADAISEDEPLVLSDTSESQREDGNNVDLDSEYIEIARTQLQYQYAIRQISQEFSRLRTAIEG